MKTKFYWVALLASAAMIAQAKAGGHHGGGGGTFAPAAAPVHAAGPAFNSVPGRSFGPRMMYSGQRFSSIGLRSPSAGVVRQHYINSNRAALIGQRRVVSGNINRDGQLTRFSNGRNRALTNARHSGNGASQVRSGSSIPSNWRNHVFAQHSATWHRDWDRRRDHWWQGHHCRFINGSWVIFDFGFDPWWPGWYPYDYYAYDYPYSSGYDPGYYYDAGADQVGEYYNQNGYADQQTDSTLALAQERLAQEGYYNGAIDGILGPQTRRAILNYQSNHGLRVSGYLTTDTLQALGLQPIASN